MCHVLKQIHLITCVKKRACAFACKEKNNQIGMKTASIFSPGTDLVPYYALSGAARGNGTGAVTRAAPAAGQRFERLSKMRSIQFQTSVSFCPMPAARSGSKTFFYDPLSSSSSIWGRGTFKFSLLCHFGPFQHCPTGIAARRRRGIKAEAPLCAAVTSQAPPSPRI